MIVRQLSRQERYEAMKISMIAFHVRTDDPETQRAEYEDSAGEAWGAFAEDGRLMARITNWRYRSRLLGRTVENGGIGGVSTLPEYRDTGAIRAIFSHLLPAARQNGEVISTLYPFSHAFYRKFGYETVTFANEFTFAPAALRGHRHTGWTRMWTPEEPVTEYAALYGGFASRYQLAMQRTEEHMAKVRFQGSWHRERRFRYLLGDGSGPTAYVMFEDVYCPGAAKLAVTEAVWKDRNGFEALLGFLARFTADYGEIVLPLPTGLDLRAFAEDPYAFAVRPRCNYMIRVVDAEKALALLDAPEAVTVRLYGDGQIPGNNGVWRVEGGRAARTEGEADLSLSVRALGPLLCGAVSLEEALLRPDAEAYRRRELLGRVFVRRPVYVGDHF